jgi:hypothetical protein
LRHGLARGAPPGPPTRVGPGDPRRASRPAGAAQILNQFGDLPPETLELQRYAAWKAADINKALREGRTPAAGAAITASDAAELDDLVGDLPCAPARSRGRCAQTLGGAMKLSGG